MVKNIDVVTGEVFQLMAFVYLNHKKNLKKEKRCNILVLQALGCGLAICWLNKGFTKKVVMNARHVTANDLSIVDVFECKNWPAPFWVRH